MLSHGYAGRHVISKVAITLDDAPGEGRANLGELKLCSSAGIEPDPGILDHLFFTTTISSALPGPESWPVSARFTFLPAFGDHRLGQPLEIAAGRLRCAFALLASALASRASARRPSALATVERPGHFFGLAAWLSHSWDASVVKRSNSCLASVKFALASATEA